MPFFTADETVPTHDFTPRVLVAEEAWGEIWRAEKDGRGVILVAYTTPEGQDLFDEAAAKLAHWKLTAEGASAPHLLRILEISEGAIPYFLAEDPGGPTLRQHMASQTEGMPLEEQGRMALNLSKALNEAEVYAFAPVGITPDTIFLNRRDRDVAWQILPVAPATKGQLGLLCGGVYFPPQVREAARPATMNADSYSLAWIWGDTYRRDFSTRHQNVAEGIPYKGLRFVLEICLEMRNDAFTDAGTINGGVDRWLRKSMLEDVRAEEEAERIRKRGPVGNFLYNSRGAFKVLGITVAVLAVLGGALYGLWNSDLFKPPLSTQKAEDVAQMFMTALISDDVEKAQSFVSGASVRETADMADHILAMESKGSIAKWNGFGNTISDSGETAIVYTTLYDSDKQAFALVTIRLQQKNNFDWYVRNLFFKPLKYEASAS